jgi:origin recognition complex subunit 4
MASAKTPSVADKLFLRAVDILHQDGDRVNTPGFFKRLSLRVQEKVRETNGLAADAYSVANELVKCSVLEARCRFNRLEKQGLLTPKLTAGVARVLSTAADTNSTMSYGSSVPYATDQPVSSRWSSSSAKNKRKRRARVDGFADQPTKRLLSSEPDNTAFEGELVNSPSAIISPLPTTSANTRGVPVFSATNDGFAVLPTQTVFRPKHSLFPGFQACRNILRKQLSALHVPDTNKLIGIDAQRAELQTILEQTMQAAENNSVLLVGSRGTGKSLLLNHVLKSMAKKFAETPKRRDKGDGTKDSSVSSKKSLLFHAKSPICAVVDGAQYYVSNDGGGKTVLDDESTRVRRLDLSPEKNCSSSRVSRIVNGDNRRESRSVSNAEARKRRSLIKKPRVLLLGDIATDFTDVNSMFKKFNATVETHNNSSVTHVVVKNFAVERSIELLEVLAKPHVRRSSKLGSGGSNSSFHVSSQGAGAYVVSEEWIDMCVSCGYSVDEAMFEPEDPTFEHCYGISIKEALARRKGGGALLQHFAVFVAQGVSPARSKLRKCINDAGGQALNSLPKRNTFDVNVSSGSSDPRLLSPLLVQGKHLQRLLVIGEKSDIVGPDGPDFVQKLKDLGVEKVYTVNALLHGLLHRRFSWDDNILFDLINNTFVKLDEAEEDTLKSEIPRMMTDALEKDAPPHEREQIIAFDDGLSKYERDRLARIRGNQAFLATLGLTSLRRDIAEAMGRPQTPENSPQEEECEEIVPAPKGSHAVGKLSSTAPFVVIRLNGLLHSDEKIALREISRQLFLEYESNQIGGRSLSFGHHVQLLLDVLKEAKGVNVPILFVLDEFHEFAIRKKQTLLYHLLDILQSGETQMAVVGLTEKLDVIESLEKRIKSRFSHRQIYVPPISFEDTIAVMQQALELPVTQCPEFGLRFALRWNREIAELMESRSLKECLERFHKIGHPTRWFLRLASVALSFINFSATERLSYTPPFLTSVLFQDAIRNLVVDRREFSFKMLTVVEIMLLISVAHLEKCATLPYNFEICFDEYTKLLRLEDEGGSVGISTYTYSKPIMFKAFEHLLAIGLCKPVGAGSANVFHGVMAANSSTSRQYDLHFQAVRLLVDLKHLRTLFRKSAQHLPTLVKSWSQKWL